jgi:hypothetical protein
MYAEQKLMSRSIDPGRLARLDSTQSQAFSPESSDTFAVKSYWIDSERMNVFTADQVPPALRRVFFRTVGKRKQVLLLVHPESEKFYRDVTRGAPRGNDFRAAATATGRTVVTVPAPGDPAIFVKLSLDREIGGLVRTVTARHVVRSIGTMRVLDQEANLPEDFRVLPEVIGMVPKGMETGGMIVRTIPHDIATGQRRYVPLFSLYAAPPEGGPPLLARMIASSGDDPTAFVRDRIIAPFIREWTSLVVEHGLIPEPHAQNVLLEIGKDGLPTGHFLHRDFADFRIDFRYRDKIGLETPRAMPLLTTVADDYGQGHIATEHLDRLDTYFDGGFLYNLDREMPAWQRRGWLGGTAIKPRTFSRLMNRTAYDELRRVGGQPRWHEWRPRPLWLKREQIRSATVRARVRYQRRIRTGEESGTVTPRGPTRAAGRHR